MRGVEAAFDRRLLKQSDRPLAVALSGGGDSVALTLMADAWARAAGRRLILLTVDHGLQPGSGAWVDACAALATRLGYPFRTLKWTGDKPDTGLPAAARAARHRLLAEAAREAGASVLLMGHTADDVLEARAMRAAGSTTPDAREWAPSPTWPEGRGVFVLRPLLGLRRAALRSWLSGRAETWIEDPANIDLRYARSRARATLDPTAQNTPSDRAPLALGHGWVHALGLIRIERAYLRSAAPDDAAKLLAVACVCAGGGDRRPSAARIARLTARVRGDSPLVATLAGARIEADRIVHIAREPGEAARGGLGSMALPAGEEVVWDGRFSVIAHRPGLTMRPVAGIAAKLPAVERRRLALYAAGERGGLPVILGPDGALRSPALSEMAEVDVVSLVGPRLLAAAGLVTREPA